jgi:nicotinamide-nucleotide amidase
MRIQLLMTGSELMSGTTVDSNSARIADSLATIGLTIQRKVTVGDDLNVLIQELQAISQNSDLVIVNGGLGPTSDDLTAEALAHATNTTLTENTQALAHLQQWCTEKKMPLNAANRKQAYLPASAFLIPNAIGSAVGFGMPCHQALVLCTPGVPRELDAMLANQIIPLLQQRFPAAEKQRILRMHLFGIGESQAQDIIDKEITDWPANITLGFRAGMPTIEIKLFVPDDAATTGQALFSTLQQIFSDQLVSMGNDNLSSSLLGNLDQKNKTLACAESCTGGLISSLLTEVPGSSRVFTAGFIAYSNAMKISMLGVNPKTLEQYGAVSEETAQAMLAGALQKSGADYALAVTGIAGPEGGSEEKPVGTVWIAWGDTSQSQARCFSISGPRKRFQQLTAAIAQDLMRRHANQITTDPLYFQRWLKE